MVIYGDCASIADIERLASDERIGGFTTNPSLMKSAGVTSYRAFAKTVLGIIGEKDVSFEVLADDELEMERQAREIASWGPNVFVKIPITYTNGVTTEPLMRRLDAAGVRLNITAILTKRQMTDTIYTLPDREHILSVFAGRIADTGRKPYDYVWYAKKLCKKRQRILWASARQIQDYYIALKTCDIITLTPALIEKLALRDKNLKEYSRETVQQFHRDGQGISF